MPYAVPWVIPDGRMVYRIVYLHGFPFGVSHCVTQGTTWDLILYHMQYGIPYRLSYGIPYGRPYGAYDIEHVEHVRCMLLLFWD